MKCSKCSTEMTALESYRCPTCGRMTCLQHRMPDRHDCEKDSELQGIEVNSLFSQDEKTRPQEPAAPVSKPVSEPRTFQREQLSPEKKKRFGLF